MTLVTCNLCAGVVTGVSRIAHSSARVGARHAGRSESKAEALLKLRNAPIPTGRHRLEAK